MAKKNTWPLLVSVALNLVLIGLLAGILLNLGTQDRPGRRDGARADRAPISRQSREAVRDALRQARTTNREAREQNEQARAELYERLTAMDFDPAAARSAFAALRQTETELELSIQTSLVEKMQGMSLEERTALAGRLHRRRGRPRR